MANEQRDLKTIVDELAIANEALANAQKQESMARNISTDCINRVNTLQKEFDAALLEYKRSAPTSSDWQSKRWAGDK